MQALVIHLEYGRIASELSGIFLQCELRVAIAAAGSGDAVVT